MRIRDGPPNGSNVKLQAAFTRERTGGAPLAAMHKQLTLSVCKRRDAVRLAQHQPARPAGAAFGGLSASALSWAAPRQTVTSYATNTRCALPTGARAISRFHACGRTSEPKPLHVPLPLANSSLEEHGAWVRCLRRPRAEASICEGLHRGSCGGPRVRTPFLQLTKKIVAACRSRADASRRRHRPLTGAQIPSEQRCLACRSRP